jgi:hypothetical protein
MEKAHVTSYDTRKRFILMLILATVFIPACEKDVLENYRRDYSGRVMFTTIREDMTIIPPRIIDTILFEGRIEPVYSNREDLIRILFMPGLELDAVLSESAYLSLPALPSEGSTRFLSGFFTGGGNRIEFSYRVSSGIAYSVNHTVSGIKQ